MLDIYILSVQAEFSNVRLPLIPWNSPLLNPPYTLKFAIINPSYTQKFAITESFLYTQKLAINDTPYTQKFAIINPSYTQKFAIINLDVCTFGISPQICIKFPNLKTVFYFQSLVKYLIKLYLCSPEQTVLNKQSHQLKHLRNNGLYAN